MRAINIMGTGMTNDIYTDVDNLTSKMDRIMDEIKVELKMPGRGRFEDICKGKFSPKYAFKEAGLGEDVCDDEQDALVTKIIVGFIAMRAADRFTDMVNGMCIDRIELMLSLVSEGCSVSGFKALQGMFYANGMDHAAEDLDTVVLCARFCEDIFDFFIDYFMETDEIKWFMTDDDEINKGVS